MMTNSKRVTIKDVMEEINKLKVKAEEVDSLKKRLEDLETKYSEKAKDTNVMSIKKLEKKIQCKKCRKAFHSEEDLRRHDNSKHCEHPITCNSCEKRFSKSSDLEDHLEKEHRVERSFGCEKCNMQFMLKWRLHKHMNIHKEKGVNIRFCHYFNNFKPCPFEKLGCMFKHESAPNCNFKEKCSKNLCQFQHTEEEFKKGDNCKFFKTSSEKLENNSCSSDTHKYEKECDNYNDDDEHIKCYYCSYISKSNVLDNIQSEIHEHLGNAHKHVVESFKANPDTFNFEDEDHEDFIHFFIYDMISLDLGNQ